MGITKEFDNFVGRIQKRLYLCETPQKHDSDDILNWMQDNNSMSSPVKFTKSVQSMLWISLQPAL